MMDGAIDFITGLITGMLKRTDEITRHFVFNGYAGFVGHYKPLIISLVVISIALVGWGVLSGWITLSIAELTKRTLTIGFVLALSLHWDVFSHYIYNVFAVAPNEIGSTLMASMGGLKSGADINSCLEILLNQGIELGIATIRSGGLANWAPFFYGIVILILTFSIGCIVLVELIAAKFGLAVFLVLAPLIIPLCLFKSAKEAVFDGWFKHLITFAFVPVFIAATSAIIVLLLQDTIGDAHRIIGFQALNVKVLVPFTIGSVVCIGLLWRVSHLAASIAGGISASVTQSLGNHLLRRWSHRQKQPKAEQKTKDASAATPSNDVTPEK